MNANVIAALYHLRLSEEPLTTTDLAKRVFDPEGTEELRNADRKIRHYLRESYSHLVTAKKENGKLEFELDGDRVFFGVGMMDVRTLGGDEVTVGFGDVLVHRDEDGEPNVVSIEYDGEMEEL